MEKSPASSVTFNRTLSELFELLGNPSQEKEIDSLTQTLLDLTGEKDFNPNASDHLTSPPLLLLLFHIEFEPCQKIASKLLSLQAINPNDYDAAGQTPLTCLIRFSKNADPEVVEDLVDQLFNCVGFDINLPNKHNQSPLLLSLRENNFTVGYKILNNPNLKILKRTYTTVLAHQKILKRDMKTITKDNILYESTFKEKEFCDAIIAKYTAQKKKTKQKKEKPKKKKSLTKSKKPEKKS